MSTVTIFEWFAMIVNFIAALMIVWTCFVAMMTEDEYRKFETIVAERTFPLAMLWVISFAVWACIALANRERLFP
jgi:hypothetical protein